MRLASSMLELMPSKGTWLGKNKLYWVAIPSPSVLLSYILRYWCRYGKQTMGGMIKDGVSALSRYYQNNFHDGIRQASLLTTSII